jgi:hypothetical protein
MDAISYRNCSLDVLLEHFFVYRTLKFTSHNEAATLNLAVDLPSLRFHVDENKVCESALL